MVSSVGTPPGSNSYGGNDLEHPLHSPSSGRKRKLQLEQLALPMSKHKFRHHLDPDESSGDNMDESETARGLHLGSDQTDGSSSRGSSSSSSSITMGDLKDRAEMSPKIFVPRFESSASPGNPPQGSDGLYSLDSRVVIKNSKNLSCQIPAVDANHGVGEPDCRPPVPGVDDEGEDEFIEEEHTYATAQALMLSCCEGMGLHTLGLPSAKWNAEQDALPGTKRPTIDREFEDYFSMLML